MPTDVDITIEPMAGLTREHVVIDEAVETARQAIEQAVHNPGDPGVVTTGLAAIQDLEAFMDARLALHIAKEEDVLFPILRIDEPTSTTIDELIEQHDQVRARRAELREAMDVLDLAHEEVDAERARLSEGLRQAGDQPTSEQITELWETVRRLHWILQGHFGDEEDDLFLPAEELISPESLAEADRRILELERTWPTHPA